LCATSSRCFAGRSSAQAAPEGQAVPFGDEQDAASGALAGVHRDPGHACAVAPRARSAQVDLQASARTGTTAIDHETRALIVVWQGRTPAGGACGSRVSSRAWGSSSPPRRSARSFVAGLGPAPRRDGPTWRGVGYSSRSRQRTRGPHARELSHLYMVDICSDPELAGFYHRFEMKQVAGMVLRRPQSIPTGA